MLELAGAVAEFGVAFASQAGAFLIQGILLFASRFAIGFELGEVGVEFIEEAGDINLLRAEACACGGDDARVEAEALTGLNSGGSAGDAEAEMVVGSEGELVDAGGGVGDAGSVGGVDLERGVVGGDEGPGLSGEEVLGDGDGEGRALFRVGGGA